MATTDETEPWNQIPTRKRSDAPAPAPAVFETRSREISKASRDDGDGDAMIGTQALGTNSLSPHSELGLLDTKILDITSGDKPSVAPLQDGAPITKHPRVTRFLYFYFMLGFFLVLLICIIWGLIGIA